MKQKNLELHRDIETLSAADLLELFRGHVLSIRIAGFCLPDVCDLMTARLLDHDRLAYYPHAPTIGRVMTSFYEGYNNPEKRKAYYDDVPQMTHEFRQLAWPYLNPLDHVRLLLSEIWSAGAARESIDGRPMASGLGQLFQEGASAMPHQDFLGMDEPENTRAQALIVQMMAFVYVQPALAGGDLQLWAEHYNHDEFMAHKKEGMYGLDRDKIPAPSVVISPGQGELVLANSAKVHAVTTIESGLRVSVNFFVGFWGINDPLTYWS